MKKLNLKNINLKYIDKTYWFFFLLLAVIAIIAIFSASSSLVYANHSIVGPVLKQAGFILGGVLIAFIIQFVPSKWIRLFSYIVLGIVVLLLYSMLIPHNPIVKTLNGAARWVKIGIQFQPSEIAKPALIIVVADLLSRIRNQEDKVKYFYRTLVITGITVLPIFPSNLSTALLIMLIVFMMWFLARISWKYMLSTVLVAITLLICGYCIVEFGYIRQGKTIEKGPLKRAVTQAKRIDKFIEEFNDNSESSKEEQTTIKDEDYQRTIAKIAVANGGSSLFGVGPGNSQQRNFLPLAFADYIFAIIVEESGFFGVALLIFIYLSILFRACYSSSRYADYSAMLMVMGLALMLTCQALISMAVAVGLGPVTGQPLPLVSSGGTSVLFTCIYFGVLMCVSREQNELKARQEGVEEDSIENVPEIVLEPSSNVENDIEE